MSVTVADNSMENRYEARLDGAVVGVSQYELTADAIVFLHTVVAEEHEGQGVGSAIARYALDDARARGLRVRPLCPYIRGWLVRHPEYADLEVPWWAVADRGTRYPQILGQGISSDARS